ncbi:MAG: hypothetical protein NTV70_24550 [Acidobacteria bacterium]|nr:hypothetical protein [Acidobacteriota bacterium]
MIRQHRKLVLYGVTLAAVAGGTWLLERRAAVEAAGPTAPRFEVDPMWPKPLPNHWVVGNIIGLTVDAKDHIWVVHRGASLERMETYAAGNLVGHWGGPGAGYEWPDSNHGITVDHKGNVWIGGNGRGTDPAAKAADARPASGGGYNAGTGYYHDNMILKFTRDGKFLMQIGKAAQSKGSNDVENVKGAAKMFVDAKTNELIVADGYGNKRVIVFDADSGKYKRHWGAYGNKPDDGNLGRYDPAAPAPKQFRSPVHCAELSNDGFIYVCDRPNDRIQVFKQDGTYVKEVFVEKNTLGDGSAWDIAFSKDPQQKFLYLADGANQRVHVLLRDTLEELTTFGDGGRQPGQFYAIHSIATDSKGNIFTTETYRGQRVQRFVYKGLGPVVKKDQGVVWPPVALR